MRAYILIPLLFSTIIAAGLPINSSACADNQHTIISGGYPGNLCFPPQPELPAELTDIPPAAASYSSSDIVFLMVRIITCLPYLPV